MKSCFALLGLGAFLAALTVGAQPMSVSDGASQGEASLEEIARGIPDFLAHLADHSGSRRLSSPLDKMEVLIKNVDCFACLVSENDMMATRLAQKSPLLTNLVSFVFT